MKFTEISRCLCCGETSLERYISFGRVVPANTYVDSYSAITDLYRAPLEVNFCINCSHSQLSGIVAPEILYKDYLYCSGTTQTLKDHFKSLVTSSLPMKPLDKISVLDIGANDLTLLEEFKSRGVQVEGVDPAENLYELSKHKNIPVVVDFWNSNTAYKTSQAPYDLICGLNVFAHNPDPMDFLLGCRRVLKQGGRVLIEFPYNKSTIQTNDFGQQYFEHINYFTVASMAKLVERVNMRIAEIHEFPEIHGGTLRFILEVGLWGHCTKARDMIRAEWLMGFTELQTYYDYKDRVLENIAELQRVIRGQPGARPVIAYGASAKLSTLLGYMKFKGQAPTAYFNFIVDDNPLKLNKFQIDSDLLIKSTDSLKELENPLIVVTAHNFYPEIRKRLLTAGIKCSMLRYVPTVSVEELN